jgi:hypothetical protein
VDFTGGELGAPISSQTIGGSMAITSHTLAIRFD